MSRLLGTVWTYRGTAHRGLVGWRVVVVAILRDGVAHDDPEAEPELREGDLLEVRPIVEGRLSFVSYDAGPRELWQGESPFGECEPARFDDRLR